MLLTRDAIQRGRSRRGGWSRPQVKLLGGSWPLQPGWIDRLVGTTIQDRDYDLFVELKDAHLNAPQEQVNRETVDAHLPEWLRGAGLE